MRVVYCTRGTWSTDLMGRNCIPANRLFVMLDGDDELGWIRHPRQQKINLKKNHAYLIPSGLDLEWCFRASCRLVAIHFTLEVVSGIDALAGCTTILNKRLPEWLLTSIAASDEGFTGAVPDAMQLHGLLQTALGTVMPANEETFLSLHSESFKSDLKALASLPVRADMHVHDLARKLCVESDALTKRFQRHLGYGPKTWLDQRLLSELSQTILDDTLTLAVLADRFAFSSEFALSRWFKRLTGMSPTKWRKQYVLTDQDSF